jgi:hypothetical protein
MDMQLVIVIGIISKVIPNLSMPSLRIEINEKIHTNKEKLFSLAPFGLS